MSDRTRVISGLLGERSPKELQEAVARWAELRDAVEDCFDGEGHGPGCWYYLNAEQQKAQRVESFIDSLFDDEEPR